MARLLSIAKYAYNNAKNVSIGHTLIKLNRKYHLWIFYEDDIDHCSKSKSIDKLLEELKKVMIVYCQNFYYILILQKQAHNKGVKLKKYAISDKIWLNNKYIKTKQNKKLKAKFFGLFQVLYLVGK